MLVTYLDYNAAAPMDPRVGSAMLPWSAERFGNPSSRDHALGWDAAEAVDEARLAVAECVNAQANELTWTSGATEALNTAIKGFVAFHGWSRKKIVTSATEHEAVLTTCLHLARLTGVETRVLPVDHCGNINPEQLETAVTSDKQVLVAIMAANNEIGTIHPIRRIAEIAHKAGAVFLSDITQIVGKTSIDLRNDGIDIGAFSSHKMCGPKGAGALFIRNRERAIELEPLIWGGGQEQGFRGGTPNVPGIVGFGEACRIVRQEWKDEAVRVGQLRDRLEQALLAGLNDIWINGDRKNRVPNTSNIGFKDISARTLIRDMHDIAVSTRAACASGVPGPSHVLKAIGLTDDEAYSCVRFSLGRFTTKEEIDYTINKVVNSVRKLRRSKSVAV